MPNSYFSNVRLRQTARAGGEATSNSFNFYSNRIIKPRWLSGKGYHLTGRGSGSIPGSNIYFKIKIV